MRPAGTVATETDAEVTRSVQLSIGENSNYIGEGAVRYTELSVLHWKRYH